MAGKSIVFFRLEEYVADKKKRVVQLNSLSSDL